MRRVEDGDHQNGTEVVDNGDGDKKHFQADRNSSADQRDDTDGKRNIGRGGNRPSSVEVATAALCGDEGDIDKRRHSHTEHRCHKGQNRLVAAREIAYQQLAFDFEPDQKEEDCHEPVVDEVLKRLLQAHGADAQIDGQMQKVFVGFGIDRVCNQKSQNAGGEQHDAAGGLFLHELTERLCKQIEPRVRAFHRVLIRQLAEQRQPFS